MIDDQVLLAWDIRCPTQLPRPYLGLAPAGGKNSVTKQKVSTLALGSRGECARETVREPAPRRLC